MARGFRAVRHDYTPLFSEDDATVTSGGAFTGPVHLTLNPWEAAFAVVYNSGRVNHCRLLLVEYNPTDVLADGGAALPASTNGDDGSVWPVDGVGSSNWTGDLVYYSYGNPAGAVPPSDRPYNRAWCQVSAGTVTAELTYSDTSKIELQRSRSKLADAQTLLAGYGWGSWQPARV